MENVVIAEPGVPERVPKPKNRKPGAPLRLVAEKGGEKSMNWKKPWSWLLNAMDFVLAGELVRHVGPNHRPQQRHEWEARNFDRMV